MSKGLALLCIQCVCFAFAPCLRAGLPISTTNVSVTGKIDDWIYRGEIHYSRDSQIAGDTLTIPGHYVVILSEVSIGKEVLTEINNFSKRIKFLDPIIVEAASRKEGDRLIVFLFAKKDAVNVKNGDSLAIKDYQMTINQSDFTSSYKDLRIEPMGK